MRRHEIAVTCSVCEALMLHVVHHAGVASIPIEVPRCPQHPEAELLLVVEPRSKEDEARPMGTSPMLHSHAKYPRGNKDVWWYEDERGFDVYVDVRDEDGVRLENINFRIPWSQIEGAVRRRRSDVIRTDADE